MDINLEKKIKKPIKMRACFGQKKLNTPIGANQVFSHRGYKGRISRKN
jgi:hypothetical protein